MLPVPRLDLLPLAIIQIVNVQDVVHVKTKAPVRWNPSSRRMRLHQETHFLQLRKDVPDGCRTKMKVRFLGDEPRTHGLCRRNVVLNENLEDPSRPFAEEWSAWIHRKRLKSH